MTRSTIVAVRASPLSPQEPVDGFLPDQLHDAVKPTMPSWREYRECFLVEIETDDGARGCYGPCSSASVSIVRDQLAPILVGLDAFRHRVLEKLQPAGRHCSGSHFRIAASAVELALWDLRSRASGSAVADILGGPTRETVPVYASALGVDIDHPLSEDVARWLVAEGFYGQKWALPGFSRGEEPALDIARLARIRAAIGSNARLMVDALGRWTVDYFQRMLPALADAGVFWIEEPLSRDCAREWKSGHPATFAVPVAAGEHAYDEPDQLRELLSGAVDVWQPEVGWHGGLTQAIRIADTAASLGVRVFPHGACLAGAVTLAALTQPADTPAVEYHLTAEPRRQTLFEEPLQPLAGRLAVRRVPGIAGNYRQAAGQSPILLTEATDVLG